jgi:hypothetical protein
MHKVTGHLVEGSGLRFWGSNPQKLKAEPRCDRSWDLRAPIAATGCCCKLSNRARSSSAGNHPHQQANKLAPEANQGPA